MFYKEFFQVDLLSSHFAKSHTFHGSFIQIFLSESQQLIISSLKNFPSKSSSANRTFRFLKGGQMLHTQPADCCQVVCKHLGLPDLKSIHLLTLVTNVYFVLKKKNMTCLWVCRPSALLNRTLQTWILRSSYFEDLVFLRKSLDCLQAPSVHPHEERNVPI